MFSFLDYLALVLVLLGLSPFLIAPIVERKRNRRLFKAFPKSKITGLGDLAFDHEGIAFRIRRIGGSKGYGQGGSYPILAAYVEASEKTILGNEDSGRYAIGRFLILPPHEKIKIGSQEVLVGSANAATIENVRSHAHDEKFRQACAELFDHNFCHVTVASDYHFIGFWFRKVYVIQYTSLKHEIYEKPELVTQAIHHLVTCANVLGVRFKNKRSL